MRTINWTLGTLGVIALLSVPLSSGWTDEEPSDDTVVMDETDGTEDGAADEEGDGDESGIMTAVDSTAKHLENLENEVLANAPESAQAAIEHALVVSAHGNAVVSAIADGLRGQDLAEVASSMKDLNHGPPGSLGVRSQGRPDKARGGPNMGGTP